MKEAENMFVLNRLWTYIYIFNETEFKLLKKGTGS